MDNPGVHVIDQWHLVMPPVLLPMYKGTKHMPQGFAYDTHCRASEYHHNGSLSHVADVEVHGLHQPFVQP